MVDWTLPIQTKDGMKARLIAVINNKHFPRVVVVDNGVEEVLCGYTEKGTWYETQDCDSADLVNVGRHDVAVKPDYDW